MVQNLLLIGKKEIGSTDGNKYLAILNMKNTQWCASFVMWCFNRAGINFPYSASSQAPVNDSSNWEKLANPVYGCVGVWKNTNETKRKEGGHMGFYLGMNGTAASILSGNPKVDIKDYGIPKTRGGKEFVGWFIPKAAKGQLGNYQALQDHVAPNGDIGVNGVDSSIKMKNGSIGGFMDEKGNFIDLEKGIKKYQQDLWNYKHPREAAMNAALAGSVGSAGSTAAITGTVGALGLSQANDMVSGLPIENGKPNVSADSPAVKAANYAWDHPYGGKSACGAAVGTALDKFFKTKMKTPRHASTWFGAKILTIEKGREGSPDAANAQMANVSNMQANGFKMISVASTPQIGDVLCYNDPARPWWYGHVCMLSYKGWVSYYQQKSFFCYSSSDPTKAKFTLWRYNDGAGGGEDDALDAVPRHELEQVEEGDDVVAVIKQRLVDRLANGFAGGKVDDAADGGVLGEEAVHRLAVVAVGLVEGGAPAGDARDAVEHVGRGVRKVVDGDDVVSGLDQLHRGVRSDVACAACHNDCLTHIVWGLVLNTKVERGANGFCIPIPRNPRAPDDSRVPKQVLIGNLRVLLRAKTYADY